MNFASGSLVDARGREWVVLPGSTPELTLVRPLGGAEDESTGILTSLETVRPASFSLPDPNDLGDFQSCKLLRDSLRFGFRSSAGPFRSFGQINVEPRAYQLVPLLVALKLDPVRLLIADGVGIGKTIEALMIVRELIDRGEISSLAVLCPPHLAEQWQKEMRDKFNIEAELVLPSTVKRLNRDIGFNESLFLRYPFTIVSTDFVKSERNRNDFLRDAPELIIVDEAHTCAEAVAGARQQRYRLLKDLVQDASRHCILVTATPHSGNEFAFRSLLSLLNPEFANLPENLTGTQNEAIRRKLAGHMVQRVRADIRDYLDETTPFPESEQTEANYALSPEYKRLVEKALRYARQTVTDANETNRFRQRVRWWSVLALLRALASSPAAAAATLRNRAGSADESTEAEIDELGRKSVFDLIDEETESNDVTPSGDWTPEEDTSDRAKLLAMAREADKLCGESDKKLVKVVPLINGFLRDGFSPIVFCRFIHTADYLAEELRQRLGKEITVDSVTGVLSPQDREARIQLFDKAERGKRVLVCTDCLSEGINLQSCFDAVLHYDLSWNPTRHEQRDGRVDRYGQVSKLVRSITYYGIDNQIDGIVLDVLIRKHNKIRSALGIPVPVPFNSEQIIEAVFAELLLTQGASQSIDQLFLDFGKDFEARKQTLHQDWDSAAALEKRSQTMFAQRSIQADEVACELFESRDAIGDSESVLGFMEMALRRLGVEVKRKATALSVNAASAPVEISEALGFDDRRELVIESSDSNAATQITRTHPAVQGLANYVLSSALDSLLPGPLRPARRAGVIRTAAVEKRSTLLLLRLRFHIIRKTTGRDFPMLVEDCLLAGFRGPVSNPKWMDEDSVEWLAGAQPDGNVPPDIARLRIEEIESSFHSLRLDLDRMARSRGAELLESHRRVRQASRVKGVTYEVRPNLPVDILAIYQFLPAS
jgi:superfamily II DNA or RNA helicase